MDTDTGDCGERRLEHMEGAEQFYREDAELLLRLMMENRFPRIWVPNREERDLRQLLWHRHRLVQMQTRLRNQLHAVR